MKIEMQDLPKVWAALDKLIRDQHNLATVANVVSDFTYRVIGTDSVHAGEITNEELVGVFQARIDETLKHLRQRYQIDFNPVPQAVPAKPTTPPEPLPKGVFFGRDPSNFYDASTGKGMGDEFFDRWISRAADFPLDPEEAAE